MSTSYQQGIKAHKLLGYRGTGNPIWRCVLTRRSVRDTLTSKYLAAMNDYVCIMLILHDTLLSLSSSYHFLMRTARLCEVCFHALVISRGILQRRRLEYYRGVWDITEEEVGWNGEGEREGDFSIQECKEKNRLDWVLNWQMINSLREKYLGE